MAARPSKENARHVEQECTRFCPLLPNRPFAVEPGGSAFFCRKRNRDVIPLFALEPSPSTVHTETLLQSPIKRNPTSDCATFILPDTTAGQFCRRGCLQKQPAFTTAGSRTKYAGVLPGLRAGISATMGNHFCKPFSELRDVPFRSGVLRSCGPFPAKSRRTKTKISAKFSAKNLP